MKTNFCLLFEWPLKTGEHTAILLTCIKQYLVLKNNFCLLFEWPLKTGFTVHLPYPCCLEGAFQKIMGPFSTGSLPKLSLPLVVGHLLEIIITILFGNADNNYNSLNGILKTHFTGLSQKMLTAFQLLTVFYFCLETKCVKPHTRKETSTNSACL